MACKMKENACNLHVLKALRYWASDNSLTAKSSLWFHLNLPRDKRYRLWRPINDRIKSRAPNCRVKQSMRNALRDANKISDVQALAFKNLAP